MAWTKYFIGCNGDSGGPLYCSIDSEWKQFGIASFVVGKDCNKGQTGWFMPFRYPEFIKQSHFSFLKSLFIAILGNHVVNQCLNHSMSLIAY